jgi:2-polyprenyl-6-methoxyphenol hydroxylase-like FAD-dependent oxidoreductase
MTAPGLAGAADTPVLIAGGGPAGLAAAAELSLHGVPCVVVEPRAQVSHRRPRAKTTSARTMEHLRRWGVAGRLRAAAPLPVAWSQRVVFCESLTGNQITEFDGAFGLTPRRDDRFAEPGQQVPQPVVEEVLRAHLRERPGVQLRLGHAVTGLAQDGGGVTVSVRDGEGSAYTVRARYVLGCDGAGSVVREQVGVRFAGRSDPRPNFNVVFRAPGLDTHLGPAVQYWVVGGPTTGLIGRLDLNGTWWAGFPGIDASYGSTHASELITGLVGRPAAHEVLATDPWTARLMLADRFGAGRVLLAGEAAHVNPPWGGHGFNTSVGDAVNIAWKIAAVTHGWAQPQLLDSYEHERRGVAEQTLACAESNMGALAGDLPADAAAIQRAKASEFYSLGLVLGYSYAGSPLVQPSQAAGPPSAGADTTGYAPAARPGDRLPHAWFPDGASLYDRLGTGFTLVGPEGPGRPEGPKGSEPQGPGGLGGSGSGLAARARARGIPLTFAEPPPDYPWRDDFLLVRPDQHIAWRTSDPDAIDLDVVTGSATTTARRS